MKNHYMGAFENPECEQKLLMPLQTVNVTQKFIDELAKYSISIFEVDFDEPEETQNEIKDWIVKSGHLIDSG